MDKDQKAQVISPKNPFSRWVIADLISLAVIVLCLVFSWRLAAAIITMPVFVFSIIVLVVAIRQRKLTRGLGFAIGAFFASILIGFTAFGLLIYHSEAMSLARSAKAHLDVSDVSQEFVTLAQETAVSSAWKELRSTTYGYVFQYPENWQLEKADDEKMAAAQWKKAAKDDSVSCIVIFTLTNLETGKTLKDYIDESYDLSEHQYVSTDITRASFVGFRTYAENDNYGFADWFAGKDKVFSFSQLNSGGEKDACELITKRIEESFSFTSSE